MNADYSYESLLDFLNHTSQRGLMPAATATALSISVRNVLGILDENERRDVRNLDLDKIFRRFMNKRAKDLNPSSMTEYNRRTRRAIEHFIRWREDPANYSVKTRATTARKHSGKGIPEASPYSTQKANEHPRTQSLAHNPDSYQSAFPVRPGHIVTINNIPHDLTKAEADRLAQFIQMLVIA